MTPTGQYLLPCAGTCGVLIPFDVVDIVNRRGSAREFKDWYDNLCRTDPKRVLCGPCYEEWQRRQAESLEQRAETEADRDGLYMRGAE